MMKSSACLAAIFSAAAAPAAAQPLASGTYWGIHVGAAFPPDQTIEGTFGESTAPDFATFTGEAEFNTGFHGSVVFGVQRGALSLELEGFYQALNPNRFGVDFDPDPDEFFVGDGSVFGGMANIVYTINTNSRWHPRIGGGVGYGRITFDIDNAFDDSDGGLAYQGFVGVGYQLSEQLEIQVNGRYLGLSNVDFDDSRFATNAQFDSLAATVGLVWRM